MITVLETIGSAILIALGIGAILLIALWILTLFIMIKVSLDYARENQAEAAKTADLWIMQDPDVKNN